MMASSYFRRVACGAALALLFAAGAQPAAAASAGALTAEQRAALEALPELETAVFDEQGVPTMLTGRLGHYDRARPEGSAQELLRTLRPLLRSGHREALEQVRAEHDDVLGRTYVRLRQSIDGIEVVGGELVVQVDPATQTVELVSGRFLPAPVRSAQPELDAHAALEALRARLVSGARRLSVQGEPALAWVFGEDGAGRLAWATVVEYTDAQGEPQKERVFVDARTGALLERHGLIQRVLDREVWDAQNQDDRDGRVRVIDEGGSSTDAVAQNAYDFSGGAWTYYMNRHGWDSYNGAGALIHSTVHYRTAFNNAFWDAGLRVLVFGDGDGTAFSPLSGARDVVAHELTHAVVDATAGLVYSNESGALNEAMADIFGAAAEANALGQSANTWLIGEAVRTPNTAGDALRYMNNPTADGSSRDYYPERYVGTDDNGGVHWNSGIANLAFFLMSQGGTHPRAKTSVNVRSIGMQAAERIFFRALRFYLTSGSTFSNARQATARAAWDLFGHNSQQHRAVCEAWDAVAAPGMKIGNCLTVGDGLAAPTSISTESLLCYGWTDVSWPAAPGATRYEVYASVWSDDFGVAGRVYSGSATWMTFNADTSRYVRVKACNSAGCGPLSLAVGWAYRYPSCL